MLGEGGREIEQQTGVRTQSQRAPCECVSKWPVTKNACNLSKCVYTFVLQFFFDVFPPS